MLLYIIIGVFVISIIGLISVYRLSNHYDYRTDENKKIKTFICYNDSSLKTILGIVFGIFSIALLISIYTLCNNYIFSDAVKRANEELYDSLIYKSQTESIRDEFGIVNKEYIDEIQNWNEELVSYKELTNNFWVGIFYPDWFNEFKTIDLNKIEIK